MVHCNVGNDVHVRIQELFSGGGGPGLTSRKQSGQRLFLVLNLFYSLQRASNGFITDKTILSKDPEGVQHFPGGGGPTFSTGVQMLISIEIHITCRIFQGGGVRTPYPPSGSALDVEH